jgi:hypothetical protein
MLPVTVPMVSRPFRALLVAGIGLLVDQPLALFSAGIAAVPLTAEVGAADEEPRVAEPAEKLDENREGVHPAAPDERKLDAPPSPRDPPTHASAYEGPLLPAKASAGPRFFPPAPPLPSSP